MKKPRGDSKLKTMPPEQQAQVIAWLQAPGGTREAVRDRIAREFGIQTNPASLSDFYIWHTENRALTEQFQAANSLADDLKDWLIQHPDATRNEETINQFCQFTFEAAAAKSRDVKTFVALKELRQNDQSLKLDAIKAEARRKQMDLAEEALKLERQKFEWNAAKAAMAMADAIKAIKSDKGLNEDQKLQAVRERLFGIVPVEKTTDNGQQTTGQVGSRGAEARRGDKA